MATAGRWVFAHGVGGSQDLPIPLTLALAGAAAALAVSFTVLVLAWRSARFDASTQGRPVPGLDRVVRSPVSVELLGVVGVVVTAYVAWAAIAGPDNGANPTFGFVYVLLWVGIVPGSLLFGPFYRALNPVRAVHRLLSRLSGGDPAEGAFGLPSWVGLWPGALGLLAFVWLELVWPESTYLSSVRLWFAAYAAIVLIGAALFGDRWISAADPFEVFSTLLSHLSVFGRTATGALVVRTPLRNLDGVPALPGLVAVVSVLVGSTAWDSFSSGLSWQRFVQTVGADTLLLDTLGLLAFCLAVGMSLTAATRLMTPARPTRLREAPGSFAHSMVPIVVGYLTAHYLSYFVEVGQQTVIALSDPLVEGADRLGTADLTVSYWLSAHPSLLASIKVGAIVLGHVLGVVAAHDRSLQLLPPSRRLTGQLPLLVVMVGYTVGGIYLLLTV